MPIQGEEKLPEDMCSFVDNLCGDDDFDTKPADMSNSSRSSSPEDSVSLGSGISVCSEGSSALSDTSEDAPDPKTIWSEEMILGKLKTIKISETPTIPLRSKGGDDRHLFQTSWKLATTDDPKKSRKQNQQKSRPPGELLREMAFRENQQKYQAVPRHNNKPWKRNYRRNPSNYQQRRQRYEETEYFIPTPAQPIMVSYADGTSSLSLTTMLVEGMVVSNVVDTCHVFVNQPENPSVPQFQQLENGMFDFYSQDSTPELLRPIAEGSLISTPSEDGWFRGQVCGYNEEDDSAYIKFVDYGGYAWLPADQLRQLRSDFLSLPFQAVECYVANVYSAEDDTAWEAASHLLTQGYVSIQLVNHAEDGVPVVALYYNQDDAMVMFTQDVLDQYVLAVYGSSSQSDPDLEWPPLSESDDALSIPESTEVQEENEWFPNVSTEYPEIEGNGSPVNADDCVEYTSDNTDQQVDCPLNTPAEYFPAEVTEDEYMINAYYPPSYPHDTVYYVTHPAFLDPNYGFTEYNSEDYVASDAVEDVTEFAEDATTEESAEQANPYENWSQEDYEEFYGCDESQQ